MFKYSKDGVSVLTILDTRRAKINGLFPVKVQVVFRRKQKYYSTGKELSKEDWDRLLKAKSQLLMEVRTDIESSFSNKNRHKAQRKAKFYINKCRSASCMQSGWKRTPA